MTEREILQRMTDYLEKTHGKEIYDGHGGDDSEGETCSYCEAIQEARDLLAKEPEPVRVLVQIDGDLVQYVGADGPARVAVQDFDMDGLDESYVDRPWRDEDGKIVATLALEIADRSDDATKYIDTVFQAMADQEIGVKP